MTKPKIDDVLWTVQDVARFLQCSTSKVYKLAEGGGIPSLHIGALLRFDPAVIRSWATSSSTEEVRDA